MKIFGIGLSKTGTSSLATALQILGYRVKDYPGIEVYRPGDLSCIGRSLLETYDALTDTPIPSFYRELDRAFPGSKFILTIRERDGWLKSCQKQFTEKLAAKQNEAHNRLFMDLYGTTVFDAAKFSAGYDRFVADVMDYFRARPKDLLVMDITAGEGWEKLCPFLGRDIPDAPFPKANVTSITWLRVDSILQIIKQAGDANRRSGVVPNMQNLVRRLWHPDVFDRRVSPQLDDTQRMIGNALARLHPAIPIVFRGSDPVPFSVRRQWNHYWLVDALGQGESVDSRCLNVALIQDGAPFLAVSYAPHSQFACFGRADTGLSLRLQESCLYEVDAAGRIHGADGLSISTDSLPLGMQACLAMCENQREWQTDRYIHKAQFSTVLLLAEKLGYSGIELASGERIRFNTPDLMLAGIRLRRDKDEHAA